MKQKHAHEYKKKGPVEVPHLNRKTVAAKLKEFGVGAVVISKHGGVGVVEKYLLGESEYPVITTMGEYTRQGRYYTDERSHHDIVCVLPPETRLKLEIL